MQTTLQRYLTDCQPRFSSEHALLTCPSSANGYHTCLPPGTPAHPPRESLDYALALLQAGGGVNEARAAAIIRKVVSLQDSDPFSRTYGVWSWYMEESLAQMNPPDWNWADFLGARLAQLLRHHASQLPADLITGMRASLGHASWSIFRRNIHLEYTNIAIMGAGVTAAAGEILGETRLLDYGRERLRRIIALTKLHGSFTEYNSPTYTYVVLEECERILHVCCDTAVRNAAEELRCRGWQVIAEHFHPGTQQWAGPQSRAYSDRISASLAHYLTAQTGVTIQPHPTLADGQPAPDFVPPRPCPVELRPRFGALPTTPYEVRTSFLRGKSGADRIGTAWFTEDACLGSISHDDIWYQRRPLLGYWRTAADPTVVLRLRFLHDGRDFASAYLRNDQRGPRVLSAFTFLTDRGDYHPHFYRPANGIFQAEDFRIRYELIGADAHVETLEGGRYALVAGEYRAVIHTAPGQFGEHAVRWETGAACVDGICYHGDRRGFDLTALGPVTLVGAMELLPASEPISPNPITIQSITAGSFQVIWGQHRLDVPANAAPYQ